MACLTGPEKSTTLRHKNALKNKEKQNKNINLVLICDFKVTHNCFYYNKLGLSDAANSDALTILIDVLLKTWVVATVCIKNEG